MLSIMPALCTTVVNKGFDILGFNLIINSVGIQYKVWVRIDKSEL